MARTTAKQAAANRAAAAKAKIAADAAAAKKAAAAKADAAALAKAAANRATMAKAAAAEAAKAKKKEDAYIANFSKVTSPTSAGLYTYGERIDMSGGTAPYNSDIAATDMTGTRIPPKKVVTSDAKPDDGPDNKPKEISDATRDAFAMLTDLFRSYGLEELAGEIADYMGKGFTSGEALIKLKTNPNGAYATRFAGNFERVKKGLNVLSEAEYISDEKAYAQTLKAYGLGNMLSNNSKDNYKKFAEFIAADISPVEFKDRIDLAVTRVKNADPFTRNTLKSFYNINDTDLVSYFLSPTENLPKLQQKVTAAEIGGSAIAQGLTTSATSALSLAEFGLDKTDAQQGYRYIAQALPRGSFLSDISSQGGPAYTQSFAEDVALRKSGKALTQQERLIEEETSRFKGSSGVADSKSLASQNRGAF
jgi:hypothetical protein